MKFCYANRRMTLYPNSVDPWDLAPEDYTDQFLIKVKDMGFDALEIGSDTLDKTGGSEKAVKEYGNSNPLAERVLEVEKIVEVPVEKIVDDFDFIDEVDKVPFEPIVKAVPLPKDFNPISDLAEVKETIDDIIRLDIEDDIDELDDIDDIIEQQGLSRRTEIAKEESIAGIPEIVIREMREKYGSSDKEIVKVLNKFLDIKKKNAKDLVESVD